MFSKESCSTHASHHETIGAAYARSARPGDAGSAGCRCCSAARPRASERSSRARQHTSRCSTSAGSHSSLSSSSSEHRTMAGIGEGGEGGQRQPDKATAGNKEPILAAGADTGAALVSLSLATHSKKTKTSLEDNIARLKQQRQDLQSQKVLLAKNLRSSLRKKRRLKKRAGLLSSEDLFELCRMKQLNPDAMEDEQSTTAAASMEADARSHASE